MDIPLAVLNRKGARKAADIPPDVLTLLEKGLIETANLTEWLAVDQLALLRVLVSEINLIHHLDAIETRVSAQKKPTSNNNTKVIGLELGQMVTAPSVLEKLRSHPSDVVRCWGCWAESIQVDTMEGLLNRMKPYAQDGHFGVREVVIFATKERLAADLSTSINLLKTWCFSEDENIRRYAAEVLRPNGVWTKKIAALHQNPEIGLPTLAPLKSDPSRYVQNAVANWLNDASKSNPTWVRTVCAEWSRTSDTKETAYITKRAMRTINA